MLTAPLRFGYDVARCIAAAPYPLAGAFGGDNIPQGDDVRVGWGV